MKVSIEDQIEVIEQSIANCQATIDTLNRLRKQSDDTERVSEEISKRMNLLPKLRAIMTTLQWIKKNRDLIYSLKTKSS
jgi:hypothetical protein